VSAASINAINILPLTNIAGKTYKVGKFNEVQFTLNDRYGNNIMIDSRTTPSADFIAPMLSIIHSDRQPIIRFTDYGFGIIKVTFTTYFAGTINITSPLQATRSTTQILYTAQGMPDPAKSYVIF